MALRAEEIYREIESEGNVSYERVLAEIERRLNIDIVKTEDKQILEALKLVHEKSMYAQIRKNSKILQDEQAKRDAQRKGMQHTSEEISEDLKEIARSGVAEEALDQIVENSYLVFGGRMTESQIIEGINEDAFYYYDIIDVIRVNKNIRELVRTKLLNCDEEDREDYSELLDEIIKMSDGEIEIE